MSESNQNFAELKQLLKLKRHEVPPPGYFNHFSSDVISRIRSGEARGNTGMEQLEGSWVMKFLRIFEAKPGVIGGFATSLCLLLLVGVVMADRDGSSGTSDMASGTSIGGDSSGLTAATGPLLPVSESSGITVSTNSNPIHSFQPGLALFGGAQQNPLFQQASFMTSGQ